MEAYTDIDVEGVAFRVLSTTTAREAVDAIRDFFGLQNGGIVMNGTGHVLPGKVIGEVTGALSFVGGQRAGMSSFASVPAQPAPQAVGISAAPGAQTPPPAGGTVAAAATEAVSDVVPTAIDRIVQTPVNVKSPTTAGDHLSDGGFARFVRKPLSLDTSIIEGHQMFANADADLPFCPSLGHDERVGTLALNEQHYYSFFATYALSGIQESTLRSGEGQWARTLFAGAFGKSVSVQLPFNCQPEFATRVKEPARAACTGEIKPIDDIAMEEQSIYSAIAMSDSYFSTKHCRTHRLFYTSPPIGCSTLGAGPMGMLFAVEWIGVLFLSIISQPFFAGSPRHQEALAMFDKIESSRGGSDPLRIPRSHVLYSNPREKYGVAWGEFGDKFIKIIEAPFLTANLTENPTIGRTNFKKDHTYVSIIGEEACKEANWESNSVFFYHLYKVMAAWQLVWRDECTGDDAKHRGVFVPVEMLYGEFSVCLRSPIVGESDAGPVVFNDAEAMSPIVEAVLWLARKWQLLYIDLRPPNVRVCRDGSLRLVDYDDLVVLTTSPCCDHKTVCILRENVHVQTVFDHYRQLAQLFDAAAAMRCCPACASNGG